MPIDLNVRQISLTRAKPTKAALDRLTNLFRVRGNPKTISIYIVYYMGYSSKKGKDLQLAISLAQRHAKTFSQVNHLWDIINPFLGFTQANTRARVCGLLCLCVCVCGT